MIKKYFSSFNLVYPRSLVYMLQACEYDIGDFTAWYIRSKDFFHIEKRKHLVKTPKAMLLLIFAWIIVLFFVGFIVFAIISGNDWQRIIAPIIILLVFPYLLILILVILLLLIKLIQWPAEFFIIRKTKMLLKNHPALKIAIAGSFGKTSMREILKTTLSSEKKVAAPKDSYNTPLGISQFAKSLKGDEEIIIFELGEYHLGDIRKLCKITNPGIGIITGVNEAHLEKFKNLDKTAKTIFELADFLGKKPLYVNGENKPARKNALSEHIVFTQKGVRKLKVLNSATDLSGTSFDLMQNGKKFHFHSKLLGLHQIGPIVTAIDMALELGIPMKKIQTGVAQIKPYNHRLEPKIDSNGVITLDDSYNGNPDGVRAIISFLASIKNHQRFYVTPGLVEMGSQTKSIHKEIGKNLARAGIEKVILIKNSVTGYIEQGLKESHYQGEILWYDDAISAFSTLPFLTVKGDIVLLQNDWPDQYQ